MNIKNIYSSTVQRLLTEKQQFFLIPDEFLIRDGVACGDALVILGEINDDVINFKLLVTDGCIISKAVSAYLFQRFSGKHIEEVKKAVNHLLLQLQKNPKHIFALLDLDVIYDRISCVQAPIELLSNLIDKLLSREINVVTMKDTSQDLDCDACVRSSSISWSEQKCSIIQHSEEKKFPTDYRRKWLQLSKYELNIEERQLLHKLASNITLEDMEFLRHEKIAQCIFSNLLKYDGTFFLHTPIWKIIHYQIHRKHIVRRELKKIAEFIKNIDASFIKGMNTSSLYEDEDAIRIHLDYDILCFSEHTAWELGGFLLQRGFLLFENVFSLKKMTMSEDNIYQGHFHMQKIFDDQYKLVIDVNFPGFPVGRIGLFYPDYIGLFLSNEDQFIITLCHTFKHKNVFMKDLNDLYLMLKKRKLNFGLLATKIKYLHLEFFTSIALEYIVKNYKLAPNLIPYLKTFVENQYLAQKRFSAWPYSAEAMLAVKREDLKYRVEIQDDYPRIYLFPLILFKHTMDASSLFAAVSKTGYRTILLTSTIVSITVDNANIFISEMGIFLDNKTHDANSIKKSSIREALNRLLQIGVFSWDNVMEIPTAPKTGKWFF
ncbi:MAG: hypothetical protein E7048_00030 [Lentisphaerae bacterium]|nr:hypothetical protein [Lentisphaerota bacterium]